MATLQNRPSSFRKLKLINTTADGVVSEELIF